MPPIASDEVIRMRRLGALEKFRITRIDRDSPESLQGDELALAPKHREQGRDLVRRKRKFRAREHARIFLENLI
jgi:hypothetical protein